MILLTEQCMHCRLHLSVTITVPRIEVFFLKRIVLMPKPAKCKNEVVIEDAGAVNKSYPDFYKDFNKLGGHADVL